jgi:hypothetical protein
LEHLSVCASGACEEILTPTLPLTLIFALSRRSLRSVGVSQLNSLILAGYLFSPLFDKRCNYNAMIEYVTIRELKYSKNEK